MNYFQNGLFYTVENASDLSLMGVILKLVHDIARKYSFVSFRVRCFKTQLDLKIFIRLTAMCYYF